ncbi:serine dehydratase subunit alpha family protein [Erysipelatoclostridium sp. An173]|uniref:L-cysteine desulfidase family protein n=1 Tax=Erysipelatoclostridium sp. An173 TaxID=1965571 RepID=UPI00261DA276|nr:L-serine ammonia-lyase, iron-sulfur-dependent, subunit alpha [uncultured Thomasclavelia sp.]
MVIDNKKYQTYLQILKEELVPAMGCTEPIALAYCASKARDVLNAVPTHCLVEVSGNIIKNVKSVIVPNTHSLKGIEAAVAAGIIAGKTDRILEVIADVKKEQISKIEEYLAKDCIEIKPLDSDHILDIKITLFNNNDKVVVRIVDQHTNIILIEKNDEKIFVKDENCKCQKENNNRDCLNVADIYEFANTVKIDDIKATIERQINYNSAIAKEGLENDYGANIGSVLLKTGNDIAIKAKAMAAAGSDARMSGCELPVVINSGSGNQGLTVSLPVIEYAKELKVSQTKLYRALVLANLIAIHQKSGMGRLSAYCGAVSAGCAAGCGIAYLYGGDYKCIAHTIVNSLAITSGIICDGAKSSCAAKIAASVDAGILGYRMYIEGQQFKDGDGIVKKGVENTIANVVRLGKEGMKETDKEIIKIMTNC